MHFPGGKEEGKDAGVVGWEKGVGEGDRGRKNSDWTGEIVN